jgi:threonylcarbamoyladenosine tRNA methylthiotransferase MtaB
MAAKARKYRIVTLGCKLNQLDSAVVAGLLGGEAALAKAGEPADIVILNTCTVTHRADAEARRLIRKLRRENPGASICVTGCGARRDGASFSEMEEVDQVLSSLDDVRRFLYKLDLGCAPHRQQPVPFFLGRTRAMLKVQEGCNLRCAYCIVPKVRGRSRSVEPCEVEEGLRRLIEAGYKEIVLTGTNTGAYGNDLNESRSTLATLLGRLMEVEGEFRLRLNSIEPRAVTAALVALLAGSGGRLCRHLQVPLQSGSDAVLKAMRRNYSAATYLSVAEKLAMDVPGIAIGADVLVGFPTETAADFQATLDLIERSPIAFIHGFSYSPRPGTASASIRPLPPPEVAARMRGLMALAAQKKRAFVESQKELRLRALSLSSEVLTDNFIKARLSGTPVPRNRFLDVYIQMAAGGEISARMVSP